MMEVDVTYVFDEILGRHMERLFGSRHGIGGLQLGIGTIACLTLLADQPSGIGNTTETLEARLAEIGFRDKEKAQSIIQEMRDKGYLVADDEGRMVGGKPAESMTKLLERVFPKLPGNTLVAYFIQAVDEVLTGRKGTEVAVSHFDQTLKMQGVPLKNRKAEAADRQKESAGKVVVKESESILRSAPWFETKPEVEESDGVRIIGSAGDGFTYKLRDTRRAPAPLPEKAEEETAAAEPPVVPPEEKELRSAEIPAEHPSETGPVAEECQPTPLQDEQDEQELTESPVHLEAVAPHDDSPAGIAGEQQQAEGNLEPSPEKDKPPIPELASAETAPEPPIPEEEAPQSEEAVDDLIEKEIAGFQDELASLCPLCKEGKVREEKTATGKVYYKCTNKACNLVSWGRPHHVACPACNNPFLVEMSAEQGKITLQCPRATCRHQCTLSREMGDGGSSAQPAGAAEGAQAKPRRRVVRRRLVRKRKKG